jgi:DNA (cytosine-5)-methyltransferase 1
MQLNVVDLYAGAGGLSLGLSLAGLKVVKAVEVDDWAAETYRANLGDHVLISSVRQFLDSDLQGLRGVDVVVGGPPCQGFSISSPLRRANALDPRNDEIFVFLEAVRALRPNFVLFENVPQFQRFRDINGNTYSEILNSSLSSMGFSVCPLLLNASNFGVPQARQRYFVIAFRSSCGPNMPNCDEVASIVQQQRKPEVSAWDAISDLPEVFPRQLSEDATLFYEMEPMNDYQRLMRAGSNDISNHVPMRHTARLVERFSKIGSGMNGASVWSDDAPQKRGFSSETGTKYEQNHRRMSADKPAPTIAAHMYSTCLHPMQNRNLTIREAARLQSFPDNFKFLGKRTTLSRKLLERKGLHGDQKLNQLNQVGNAVPPLMASVLARTIIQISGGHQC